MNNTKYTKFYTKILILSDVWWMYYQHSINKCFKFIFSKLQYTNKMPTIRMSYQLVLKNLYPYYYPC